MDSNSKTRSIQSGFVAALLAGGAFALAAPAQATPTEYSQINLVTDNQAFLASQGFSPAATVDPSLVNPWGISHSATSPFWISDQGTNVSTLYNGSGVKTALTESIPGGPTGQVFNGATTDFIANGSSANFIFATLSGTIQARSGATGTTALVEQTVPGAVYTGLAIGNNGTANFLYAANFAKGTIDVFDRTFAPVSLSGSFVDPNLPAGYVPFNTQTLTVGAHNLLFVTYALPDPVTHEKIGAGLGIVAEFDLNGNFIRDVAEAGLLDAPWGLDIAPAGFGEFAGDLLVGNFGDGTINAYDPNGANAYVGTLKDSFGNNIVIPDLWALSNGTGQGNGGPANWVFFAAGLPGEIHGLFGALSPLPEPASLALLGAGLVGMAGMRTARRRRRVAA